MIAKLSTATRYGVTITCLKRQVLTAEHVFGATNTRVPKSNYLPKRDTISHQKQSSQSVDVHVVGGLLVSTRLGFGVGTSKFRDFEP